MVINSYKKYLLGLLLIAPVAVSADIVRDLYKVGEDVVTGTIGWGAHAGLGYLTYQAIKNVPLKSNPFWSVPMVVKDELLAGAGTALGVAAVYHSSLVYQMCTFGVQLREMRRPNNSSKAILRNTWAGCDSAAELMEKLTENGGRGKDALKRQLLLELGFTDNTAPSEGIKKVDAALDSLDKRLDMYSSYTNIVELTAQAMIDEDADEKALLNGDVLLKDDLNLYSKDLLDRYASNSWIHNSATIGWYFKEGCYLKRPAFYTATYNMASHCAMKTLEQYGRLKAVRHILEQYVPVNQRRPRLVVHAT